MSDKWESVNSRGEIRRRGAFPPPGSGLVLPGPAFVVIPVGLVILGTEFVWARRLLNRLKHEVESIALRRLGRRAVQKPRTGPDTR